MTRLTTAMMVAVLAAAPSYAGQSDDFQTFKQAEQQVLRYPHFTIFDSVQAQVDDGVVTLTGKVTMPYKRSDIERRVARAAGVTAVRNQIEVLPVSRFDDDLRWRIARAIYSDPTFLHYGRVNPPIHVIVDRGRVTLQGVVNSETDRRVANAIASQSMAFSVTSQIKTAAEARKELEKL